MLRRDVEIGVDPAGEVRIGEWALDGGGRPDQTARELVGVQHGGDALTLVENVGRDEHERDDVLGSTSRLADDSPAI